MEFMSYISVEKIKKLSIDRKKNYVNIDSENNVHVPFILNLVKEKKVGSNFTSFPGHLCMFILSYKMPMGVLPTMTYMGRLHPKGVTFTGFMYIEG